MNIVDKEKINDGTRGGKQDTQVSPVLRVGARGAESERPMHYEVNADTTISEVFVHYEVNADEQSKSLP